MTALQKTARSDQRPSMVESSIGHLKIGTTYPGLFSTRRVAACRLRSGSPLAFMSEPNKRTGDALWT
jgi:hypothetical protein